MIQRYAEVLAALNAGGVRYVVVGGLAVILHGHPRLTIDLDLVIDLDPENLLAAMEVLGQVGLIPAVPVALAEFADPERRQQWIAEKGMVVFQLRDPKDPIIRIDIFVEHPVAIDQLLGSAREVEFLDEPIKIASIDHLIQMKLLSGRANDVSDIEALKALRDG